MGKKVFASEDGEWQIRSDKELSANYYILHRHYGRFKHMGSTLVSGNKWAWCYRNGCSDCDADLPDEITTLIVLLKE